MSSKAKTEYYTRFVLSNFFIPAEEITQTVGIQPDMVREKGKEYMTLGGKKQISEESYWILDSPATANDSLEETLTKLLGKLMSKKEAIIKLTKKFDCVVSCGVTFYDYSAGLSLNQQIIQKLASLNLLIEFDLYFFN